MKILSNARVYTLEPSRPIASVLALDGEYIRAVGGEELLREFDQAPCQDLDGGVVLPGLTDAHFHFQEYVTSRQMVDCEVGSKDECLRRVSARARQIPAGQWVRGHGWNQNEWGGQWPSAADLDALLPDHPVYLTAKSLHAAVANGAALERAGLTPSTPEPENGSIQRTEQGFPTGLLLEGAMRLVEAAIPEPSTEALATSLREALPELWSMGLTGIHDFDRWTCFMALQLLHERAELAHFLKCDDVGIYSAKGLADFSLGFGGLGLRAGFGRLIEIVFDVVGGDPESFGCSQT
jgi:predicted amidohydrolase YtcJ